MLYVIAADRQGLPPDGDPVQSWIADHFESWTRPLEGVWIVEGALVADQIHTGLAPLLERDQRLVIVKAGTEAVWEGVSDSAARWLADQFPGSWSERIPGKTEGLGRE